MSPFLLKQQKQHIYTQGRESCGCVGVSRERVGGMPTKLSSDTSQRRGEVLEGRRENKPRCSVHTSVLFDLT